MGPAAKRMVIEARLALSAETRKRRHAETALEHLRHAIEVVMEKMEFELHSEVRAILHDAYNRATLEGDQPTPGGET